MTRGGCASRDRHSDPVPPDRGATAEQIRVSGDRRRAPRYKSRHDPQPEQGPPRQGDAATDLPGPRLLGGTLGFVPGFFLVSDLGGGFLQAPGLILALLFGVLVLNANLAVFGITLVLAKVASVVLLPVSFAVGRVLLDGPTQGLFHALINAPVFAWFGLERYATSGGLVLGIAFGCLAGFGFVRALRAFRARMASAEENSERYQKWSQKKSARFVTWVFLGKGKGKKRSYRELLEEQKQGLPVRVVGVALVAVLSVALWLGHSFLSGPAMSNAVRVALQDYNGATVDLTEATLDLAGGTAVIAGLAMTDPNELTKDTFRARSLELAIGTRDLLKKRFVIDKIESREAVSGAKRERPGERVVRDTAPPPPPPPTSEQEKTIDDYVKDAEAWHDRLVQVADWLDALTGSGTSSDESDEDRDVRIEAEKERYGLARVVAHHLIDGAPMVLVRELVFDGVKAVDLDGDLLDIRATNLSTNPRLAEGPLEMSIAARSGTFGFTFRYDPERPDAATTSFTFRGIAVDSIAGQLSASPIKGGTLDVAFAATLDCSRPDGVWVDAPLKLTLHDTTLGLQGFARDRGRQSHRATRAARPARRPAGVRRRRRARRRVARGRTAGAREPGEGARQPAARRRGARSRRRPRQARRRPEDPRAARGRSRQEGRSRGGEACQGRTRETGRWRPRQAVRRQEEEGRLRRRSVS